MFKKLLLLSLMLTTAVQSQQLNLDPSYGVNGLNATGLPNSNSYNSGVDGISSALCLLPDRSLLVPYSLNPYFSLEYPNLAPTIGVKKYLENGTLDPDFGTNGTALFTGNYHGSRFEVYAITVQPDGKIVIAGRTYVFGGYSHDYALFVCRLNANGTQDTAFGINGLVEINSRYVDSADSNDERITDLTIDSQNRIIAVGSSTWYIGASLYEGEGIAVRLLENGTPDPSFGNAGKFRSVLVGPDNFTNIYPLADGHFLLLGNTNPTQAQSDVMVVKIDGAGIPDASFGTNGMTQINFDGTNRAVKIFPDPDGKMIVVGHKATINGNGGITFTKLNPDGTLDTSFSGDGKNKVIITVPGHDPIGAEYYPGIGADHITRLPDNKYIITSTVRVSNSYDYAIARLNEDTTLDYSFMTNGVYQNNNLAFDWARNVKVQDDGKLLVLINSTVYRYLNFSVLSVNSNPVPLAFAAYPNPVKDVLHLSLAAQAVTVTDVVGKLLSTYKDVNTIDFSNYAKGIYLVRVTQPDGATAVQKVIKE